MGRDLIVPGGGTFGGEFVYIFTTSVSGAPTLRAKYVKNNTVLETINTPIYTEVIENPISFHGVQISYSKAAPANWGIYAEQKCYIPSDAGKAEKLPGDLIENWLYTVSNGIVVFIGR